MTYFLSGGRSIKVLCAQCLSGMHWGDMGTLSHIWFPTHVVTYHGSPGARPVGISRCVRGFSKNENGIKLPMYV